jgi:hypothetical protein
MSNEEPERLLSQRLRSLGLKTHRDCRKTSSGQAQQEDSCSGTRGGTSHGRPIQLRFEDRLASVPAVLTYIILQYPQEVGTWTSHRYQNLWVLKSLHQTE